MTCKIVPARNGQSGGISLAILTGIGWQCVYHRTYFSTDLEEKPRICPIANVPKTKPKKLKCLKRK